MLPWLDLQEDVYGSGLFLLRPPPRASRQSRNWKAKLVFSVAGHVGVLVSQQRWGASDGSAAVITFALEVSAGNVSECVRILHVPSVDKTL